MQLETGFEGYPPDYVSHNLPLVVLSGLHSKSLEHGGSELAAKHGADSIEIASELPLVSGQRADQLLEEFHGFSGGDDAWTSKPVHSKSTLIGFKFKTVGRVSLKQANLVTKRN